MSNFPQVKPTLLLKFFLKQGFTISRQVGSHARLIHADGRKITIAVHNKPIPLGTLQAILKQANMNKATFLKLHKK
ncbi:MAG TPA: type II toxin-antitoxin system HicA family toxin [Patescibacteria group bacterium]|nr:type II toxin-antitoxin system HicA family toxin [Patescibacteria group bacterium]